MWVPSAAAEQDPAGPGSEEDRGPGTTAAT